MTWLFHKVIVLQIINAITLYDTVMVAMYDTVVVITCYVYGGKDFK